MLKIFLSPHLDQAENRGMVAKFMGYSLLKCFGSKSMLFRDFEGRHQLLFRVLSLVFSHMKVINEKTV